MNKTNNKRYHKTIGDKLVELLKNNETAPIKYFTEIIVTNPAFEKDYPYFLYKKEDKKIIREKIKNIAIECVELLNYLNSLMKCNLDEKSKEIAENKDIDELINIIKKIML